MNLPHPYCTRADAAAWLGVSVDTVDRMLVPMSPRRPLCNDSKYPPLRYVKLWAGQIRIVTADVLAELPEPEETTSPRPSPPAERVCRQTALCV